MSGYYAKNVKEGWFSETEVLWPGQKMGLQLASGVLKDDILFEGRSDYQDILVFKSKTYGTVLVLDGVIQVTERDEHAYQEMIVHLPMFSHPRPRRVLIVGGGDGGVLREVARHPGVEHIDMCEIDSMVVDVAKKFLPTTASAYGDPRLNLVFADAAQFVKEDGNGNYDVIIVDSSDPVGPAETLFAPEFYQGLKASLAPGGVVCCQGECMWLHLDLIGNLLTACCALFPTVEYAYTTIPTYPSGQIGFFLMSNDERKNACRLPDRKPSVELQAMFKYYNPQIHRAAFMLPQFAHEAVEAARLKAGRPVRIPEDVPRPDGGCSIS